MTPIPRYDTVFSMLKKLRSDIDRELVSFITDAGKNSPLKKSSPLLYKGIKDFVIRPGKRIRPIFFILSYLGYTKSSKRSYAKLIRSSLSLELLHDFLLIHDDVIDRSALRRGKPTLHRQFNKWFKASSESDLGPNLSIVAGDVVFAMAIQALMSSDETPQRKEKALLELMKAATSTCIGEFLDVINDIKTVKKISKKAVYLTYTMKTAIYTFACPMVAGGILAGISPGEIKKLNKLGILLGHAFQIQDDMMDLFLSSSEIGKPVLSDLAESKKTLIIWKAYKDLKGTDKSTFEFILNKNKKSRVDLLRLKKLILSTSAAGYCLETASSILADAISVISSLKMKKEYRSVIEDFVKLSFEKTEKVKKVMRKA